jgi:hypothetical protein
MWTAGVVADDADDDACFVGTVSRARAGRSFPFGLHAKPLAGQYYYACYGCASCPAGRYHPYTNHRYSYAYCYGCSAGYYSGARSRYCTGCSPGYYCPNTYMSSPYRCPAGRYSSGYYSRSCSYCRAGYYCPYTASSSATQYRCPAGTYSNTGSSTCYSCPAGRYGTGASSSSVCSGYCPAGRYSGARASSCTVCPAGRYTSSSGSTSCTTYCNPGRYGTTSYASSSANCQGACAAGYYCSSGSGSPTQFACGANAVYCPAGSSSPRAASPGYYTIGGGSTTRTAQTACPAGRGVFCNGGIQQKCKAGRYGASGGLPGSDCDGPCAQGYYCPEGSTSRYAALCGGVHVYCPSGSGAPVAAPASGFYTGPLTVAEDRRYTINACPSDKSCEFGKIIEPLEYYSCPAGTLDRKVAELITSAPAGNPVDARLRAGKTGTITYSIISQTWNAGCRYGPNGNVFAIDGAGQIKLNNRQINYNDCQQFTIVTQAAFGTSIGKCTVTIDVVDKNEMPSATCGNRDVREKVAAGTLVGSPMSASDPDKGQSLIWSIVSSTPAGAPFAIGPCDGQLVVKKGGADLDYAKATAYTMTLAVKDDGSPSMSVQCTMRIDIINVNEPPTF